MVKVKAKTSAPKPEKDEVMTLVEEAAKDLIGLLEVKDVKMELSKDEEGVIQVEIDCSSPGILIGNKGETISSLQLILSLIVYKKLGNWQRIVVNVGDYRQQRKESLERMAFNLVKRVKFSGEEAILAYLNAAERRIIHLALANNPDVITESQGLGSERRLIIRLRKKSDEK